MLVQLDKPWTGKTEKYEKEIGDSCLSIHTVYIAAYDIHQRYHELNDPYSVQKTIFPCLKPQLPPPRRGPEDEDSS